MPESNGTLLRHLVVFSVLLTIIGFPGSAISASQEKETADNQSVASPEENSKKDKKERNWLGTPIVTSSPALGTGVGATGMYFFDAGRRTPGMQRSNLAVYGAYTNTDS